MHKSISYGNGNTVELGEKYSLEQNTLPVPWCFKEKVSPILCVFEEHDQWLEVTGRQASAHLNEVLHKSALPNKGCVDMHMESLPSPREYRPERMVFLA